jgi:hypothetical protein
MKKTALIFGFVLTLGTAICADLWTSFNKAEILPATGPNGMKYEQVASGWKFRFVGQIELAGKGDLIGSLGLIAMTDDGWILITDPKDTNIKLFDPAGEYVKSWGRKGQGPGEFQYVGTMDYRKPFLTVADAGRGVQIFERKAKDDFRLVSHETSVPVTDPRRRIISYHDKMIIDEVAWDKNKTPYHLFLKSVASSEIIYVMPWAVRYGMNEGSDFMQKHIAYARELGLGMSYLDLVGDDVFYVWEGELRILKINLKSKTWTSFGKETKNFVRPKLTGSTSVRPSERKFSHIWGLFADKEKVLLYYANPNPDEKRLKVFFQIYDLNGTFLAELSFTDSAELIDIMRCVYHKESGTLLIPGTIINETGTQISHVIKKYQLSR